MALDLAKDWNPYYTAYCRAHGHADDPEGMRAADEERWPGGTNAGFILWIGEQRQAFAKAHPEAMKGPDIIGDHKAWAAFLWQQGEAGEAAHA